MHGILRCCQNTHTQQCAHEKYMLDFDINEQWHIFFEVALTFHIFFRLFDFMDFSVFINFYKRKITHTHKQNSAMILFIYMC